MSWTKATACQGLVPDACEQARKASGVTRATTDYVGARVVEKARVPPFHPPTPSTMHELLDKHAIPDSADQVPACGLKSGDTE